MCVCVWNDNKPTKVYKGFGVQALYDASNLGGLQWLDPKGLQCNEKLFQTLATVVGTPPILDPGHLELCYYLLYVVSSSETRSLSKNAYVLDEN